MPDTVDIAACVHYLYRDARFKGSATIVDFNDWNNREWVDGRGNKPTQQEIETVWPIVQVIVTPPSQMMILAIEIARYDEITAAESVEEAKKIRGKKGED